MFENLDYRQKSLVYEGLLSLVRHGEADSDQGHPKFALGAKGTYDEGMCGRHPKDDPLFIMMMELTLALHEANADGSAEIGDWVYTWQDYCILMYAGRKG